MENKIIITGHNYKHTHSLWVQFVKILSFKMAKKKYFCNCHWPITERPKIKERLFVIVILLNLFTFFCYIFKIFKY